MEDSGESSHDLQRFRRLEWVASVGAKGKEQFPESRLKEALMELSHRQAKEEEGEGPPQGHVGT